VAVEVKVAETWTLKQLEEALAKQLPTRGSTCFSDGLSPPSGTQFDRLHVGYLTRFHGKPQQSADHVPSIVAAGAGIHVNESERLVAHHFQDVGVATDEQPRLVPAEFPRGFPIIIARVPADMRHVGSDALAIPNEILGKLSPKFRTVNVSVHAPDWPERPEPIEHLDGTEVSRMPNLVTFGEVSKNGVVQKSVCVGEQPDSHSPAYAAPILDSYSKRSSDEMSLHRDDL
jgi:hypothetical protein